MRIIYDYILIYTIDAGFSIVGLHPLDPSPIAHPFLAKLLSEVTEYTEELVRIQRLLVPRSRGVPPW